jgi:hypothetical protein
VDKPYAFRREDNDEVVWVDWETMMTQRAGWITLKDGVSAKRCYSLERAGKGLSKPQDTNVMRTPAPSDSLGFPDYCLDSYEKDRKEHGFTDVEFRRDPLCPEFYQVHCGTQAAKDAYTKHRGLVNMTGSLGGGVMLSKEDLDRAAEMVSR